MNTLTIAIAAYNIGSFIGECLDSVLAQTNRSFSLLVINDGSSDQTAQILAQYAQENSCMQVIHQENQGICSVRNAMIAHCQTDYLWMIDGDDLITLTAVAEILPCLDGEREAIYFTHTAYGQADTRTLTGTVQDLTPSQLQALRYKCMLNDKEPAIQQINVNSSVMSVHKVETLRLHQIAFPLGWQCGEDVMFTLQFLQKAKYVAYLDSALYLYRVNEGSISLRYNATFVETNLQWLAYLKTLIPAEDAHMQSLFLGRVLGTSCSALFLDISHPHNPKSYFVRRKEFKQLIQSDIVKHALAHCPTTLLRRNVKIARICMKLRLFCIANLFAHVIMYKRYTVFRAHGGRIQA